jgi:hypothetical protein
METAETRFLAAVWKYKIADHKRDEHQKRQEIPDINTITEQLSEWTSETFGKRCMKPNPEFYRKKQHKGTLTDAIDMRHEHCTARWNSLNPL